MAFRRLVVVGIDRRRHFWRRVRTFPRVGLCRGVWRARPPSPEGGEYGRCLPAPVVVGRVETVFFTKMVFFCRVVFFCFFCLWFFWFRESWDQSGNVGVGPAAFGVLPVSFLFGFFEGEVVSLLRHL